MDIKRLVVQDLFLAIIQLDREDIKIVKSGVDALLLIEESYSFLHMLEDMKRKGWR